MFNAALFYVFPPFFWDIEIAFKFAYIFYFSNSTLWCFSRFIFLACVRVQFASAMEVKLKFTLPAGISVSVSISISVSFSVPLPVSFSPRCLPPKLSFWSRFWFLLCCGCCRCLCNLQLAIGFAGLAQFPV